VFENEFNLLQFYAETTSCRGWFPVWPDVGTGPAADKRTVSKRLRDEMIEKLLKNGFAVLRIGLMLLIAAVAIWLFVKDSGTPIQDVLFCVGAVPIVVFSVGVFGGYLKRNETLRSHGWSVNRRSPHQRASRDMDQASPGIKSGRNWVLAGAALLLVCYLL
jgi:hypothetical protein